MSNPEKWYFRTPVLVIAILSIGPLALPLLWLNKRFSLRSKILITAATMIITYYSIVLTQYSLKELKSAYQEIFKPF